MAIIDSENQFVPSSTFTDVKADISNDFNISLSIVQDSSKKQFLKRYYQGADYSDQKNFFRDLVFSAHMKHPLISTFKGYNSSNESQGFSVFSEFPANGFLMDFMKKSKITDTQKSKYIFGVALIGSFLSSRGVCHRCFAPPCLGVSKDFDPILLMFCTSKEMKERMNATLQIGNICWLAPELDSDEIEIDKNYNYGIDVFSFGSLLYYMITGSIPFYHDNFFQVLKNKKSPLKLIPKCASEDMQNLLAQCWSPRISDRISFDDILFLLQSHIGLFPGTNLDEFDQYVRRLLSEKIIPTANTLASEELITSVKNVFNSILLNPSEKSDPKILNSIFQIREEIDSYVPMIIGCTRADISEIVWIKVPSFMFVSALKEKLMSSFDIDSSAQVIQIKETDQIADKLHFTLEQLNMKNGAMISMYNKLTLEEPSYPHIKISIPSLSKVYYISYSECEMVEILRRDIHFATRIPLDSISLTFKKKNLNPNDTFESARISNRSTIEVKVNPSFKNTKFTLNVDLSGIIGRDNIEQFEVTPLTTIHEIMVDMAKIDATNSFAMLRGCELRQYKALVDYGIKEGETIELITNISE